MELASLVLFAGALLVAAGSPGPSIAALVARVLSRGPRDVMPFLAAMWFGEAIWLSLAVWGLASIAESFHAAFLVLKWVGVLYLVYLAWRMWTAPVAFEVSDLTGRRSGTKMFAAGLAVTLGNPKIMVFYMALLPSIIDLKILTVSGWVELTAAMLFVLVSIDLVWVALAARARSLLKSSAAVRVANRCSAGIMASAAALIAAR
ncbi:LysE family translocator [Pseudohalocynthiibacter aestuariivivens]|jgi:threonine/homoserine/homoserine lactone efflux protein|uniref:LysE family translocator n=1 Tax=Pseudohalocynthiibacter aestuariivivens TaxID=1591409 RepID=A0ABV5JC95_9RHOB|nr:MULTISPECIES: LysE family translocator [Pseudohalocynthiibacter]MBS9715937.1 LysE family translocator [Pseudohalocynthiibacter aestuariivivens]MCK0102507.1 LysE family translocator [Pseudohalocynthiibacter sp. F2068]